MDANENEHTSRRLYGCFSVIGDEIYDDMPLLN